MAIRKAKPSDHRRMAEVAAKAFINDEVFGRFKFPYRQEHYADYISWWERSIWTGSNDYTKEYLVAFDETSESEVCLGWAEWSRVGPGAARRANPVILRLKRFYTQQLDYIYVSLWPNKSANDEHVKAFMDASLLTQYLWTGNREESWMLDILCTDPEHERRGHGKELVNWGIAQAQAESICTSVIAAHERDNFYARFGFVEAGRANVGPLAAVKGGAVMFRDVEGMK